MDHDADRTWISWASAIFLHHDPPTLATYHISIHMYCLCGTLAYASPSARLYDTAPVSLIWTVCILYVKNTRLAIQSRIGKYP